MAGSVTIIRNNRYGKLRNIILYWTSDASGDVSGNAPIQLPACRLEGLISIPVSGVTDAFAMSLPMSLPLENGTTISLADVSGGIPAMSNSTDGETVMFDPQPSFPDGGIFSLTISGAGNAQSGYLILSFREMIY
jgi:hypothetical protein